MHLRASVAVPWANEKPTPPTDTRRSTVRRIAVSLVYSSKSRQSVFHPLVDSVHIVNKAITGSETFDSKEPSSYLVIPIVSMRCPPPSHPPASPQSSLAPLPRKRHLHAALAEIGLHELAA